MTRHRRARGRPRSPVVWALSPDRPVVVVHASGDLDPLWSPREVADFLGWTPTRLEQETAAGRLTPLPLPGMPKRYPVSEVSRYQCNRGERRRS